MEVTHCYHKETKKPAGSFNLGTCSLCGQQTKYPVDQLGGPPIVIRLGRRNGKIVMPAGDCKVQLTGQDLVDLKLASGTGQAVHEEAEIPADIPPRPGFDDPKGRVKWFKDNKKQLVSAFLKLGAEAFKKRYNVPRQVVSHLKASTEYKRQVQKAPAPAVEPKSTKRRSSGKRNKSDGHASLPPWNDDWAPEVQLRWLEIYEKHFM